MTSAPPPPPPPTDDLADTAFFVTLTVVMPYSKVCVCACARVCVRACVRACVCLCSLTVTTPYTKAEFGTAEQGKYKAAVAAAARTAAANVDILSVTDTESQRRAGSVEVETKVMQALSSPVLCCAFVSPQRRVIAVAGARSGP